MRLIDADAKMVAQLNDFETESVVEKEMTVDDYLSLSDYDAPTIDAVPRADYEELERHFVNWEPVVRCKDCFLYGECQAAKFYGDDGYCSVGERKDDEER